MNETLIFGQYARQIAEDLPVWEQVLHYCRPKHVIELGTGNGAFSMWVLLHCIQSGARFTTFDIRKMNRVTKLAHQINLLNHFVQCDVLKNPIPVKTTIIDTKGKALLFCDNGDKLLEVRLYAPVLRPGDILAVHDWGSEVGLADIPDDFMPLPYEAEGGVTRFFEKRVPPLSEAV